MKSELDDEITEDGETSEELESPEESGEESFYEGDVPQGLDESYKNMQRDYTKKTTALAEERKQMERDVEAIRQKAEMYDKLAQDPDQAIEILSRISGKSNKNRANDLDDVEDNFDDFGDNQQTMLRLVKAVARENKKLFKEEMFPLLQSSQESTFEREMSNLSTWVKSQREKTGLEWMPDPVVLEHSIRDRMNRKGDTAIEAYKASMNLDRLPVRKPVVAVKKGKSGTFQPGGSGKSGGVGKLGLTTEDAIERRRSGKRRFTIEELTEMYNRKEIG